MDWDHIVDTYGAPTVLAAFFTAALKVLSMQSKNKSDDSLNSHNVSDSTYKLSIILGAHMDRLKKDNDELVIKIDDRDKEIILLKKQIKDLTK